MDEIFIEEKKYVSSKRAAKVTGYAKDYIGQLCREGRVPARLVGRSWYVLETAIHDHRFGNQKIGQEVQNVESAAIPSTWESPRYETSSGEILPTVNRLLRPLERPDAEDSGDDQNEVSQQLQDSWRAWFDRIADTEAVSLSPLAQTEEQEKDEPEPEIVEEIYEEAPMQEIQDTPSGVLMQEINIPIHTVYDLSPEDLLPQNHVEIRLSNDLEEVQTKERGGRGIIRVIQVAGAGFAVLIATVAILGTGYFDEYVLSSKQVSMMAGVILYNK